MFINNDSLFIVLAAICNAVMDTLAHHYSVSIFKNDNPNYWDASISWKNKYINGDKSQGRVKWIFGIDKPEQLTDAWHLFKTLFLLFFITAIAVHNYNENILYSICKNGFFYIIVFNIFYNGFLYSPDND